MVKLVIPPFVIYAAIYLFVQLKKVWENIKNIAKGE
jgi:hypothetical protein